MANNKPAHEVRIGSIKATIWGNDGASGRFYTVAASRLFKDAEGHWAEAHSFGRDDLLLLAKVLDLAHTWIVQNGE